MLEWSSLYYENSVNGKSQLLLKLITQALSISSNVWMVPSAWSCIWGRKVVLNFTGLPNPLWKELLKTRGEWNTCVQYYGQRDPMKTHYILNVDPIIIFCQVGRIKEDKVCRLRQSIHNNPYWVIFPTNPRQTTTKSILIVFALPIRNLHLLE